MRTRVTFGIGVMVSAVIGSCGGDGGPAPLESASNCTAGWQPLTAAEPYDTTSSLAYRDGVIYYARYSTLEITALPAAGGSPTAVATDSYSPELWVEGDQLIFPAGPHGTQLYSVPVAGGTPTSIFDGAAGRPDPGIALDYVLTPTGFFWTEQSAIAGNQATTAFGAARPVGTASPVGSATATLPSGDTLPFVHMALAPDAVLMASILGVAAAVPFNGPPTRYLATNDALTSGYGNLAGLDPAGVYWTIPRAGAREEDDAWTLALAPEDGGPLRTVWDKSPAHSGVTRLWPDGAGGWVAIVDQYFDDLRFHTSIWLIDSGGAGRRLACEPANGSARAHVDARPAIAPDAIYLVDDGSKFQIVRVPR